MLEEITKLKLGNGAKDIKIGNCYVSYDEELGFTLMLCLGIGVNNYGKRDFVFYPITWLKGRRANKAGTRQKIYFLDKEYLNSNIRDIGLNLVLNQKIEFMLLTERTHVVLFKLSFPIDMNIVDKWYKKNRLITPKLPELITFELERVKKKELEVGHIYTDKTQNTFYIYLGIKEEKLMFYNVSVSDLSDKTYLLENLTVLELANSLSYSSKYDTIDNFCDSYKVNKTKALPVIYNINENLYTNNIVATKLCKLKHINLY